MGKRSERDKKNDEAGNPAVELVQVDNFVPEKRNYKGARRNNDNASIA